MISKQILRIAEALKNSKRNLVFTGAGISTESGIPDFRSKGGLWDRYQPIYIVKPIYTYMTKTALSHLQPVVRRFQRIILRISNSAYMRQAGAAFLLKSQKVRVVPRRV